jgi:type II secretory pathway pseudopilin PulG
MVKNFHTLALRAMQTNQQMTAHLIRVQSGFLRAQNIEQAQETLNTLQEMLRDMQTALQAPPDTSQHRQSNYVPLK